MNVYHYAVDDLIGAKIDLGYKGEAERTQIVIDATAWIEDFGTGGLLRIRHQPYNGDPYIPGSQTVSNGVLTWTVGASDTAADGVGLLEVWYSVTEGQTEHILASAVALAYVGDSLANTGTTPAGIDDWMTRAEAALVNLESAGLHIEEVV